MENKDLVYTFREPKMDHRVSRLWGVPWEITDSQSGLQRAVWGVIGDLELKIFGKLDWRFEPQGLTLIWGLTTSHLAVHTWPENTYPPRKKGAWPNNSRGYVHVDTVVCGGTNLDGLHDSLLRRFDPLRIITEEVVLVSPNQDHLPNNVSVVKKIQDTYNYVLPEQNPLHFSRNWD